MKRLALLLALLTAAADGHSQELPPADPTVVGQLEHTGYALIGSRGRFYLFGGLAVADYTDSAGTRRIVTMQFEDQVTDQQHVYYRELREGHRWAFSRQAGRDGLFGTWIQLAASDLAAQPKWQSFQRSRREEPREGTHPGPVSHVGQASCLP
jgi:hypothetical protein